MNKLRCTVSAFNRDCILLFFSLKKEKKRERERERQRQNKKSKSNYNDSRVTITDDKFNRHLHIQTLINISILGD
mgnify:CR=1 FL=1